MPEPDDISAHPLRSSGGIAPKVIRTSDHGVLQHVDGSSELPPENLVPSRIHFLRSLIHRPLVDHFLTHKLESCLGFTAFCYFCRNVFADRRAVFETMT